MNNLQDLIQIKGLKEQLPRYNYKPRATSKRSESGREARDAGLKFEETMANHYNGRVLSNSKVRSFHGKKTSRKTDFIAGSIKYSVKNPKDHCQNTQIHLCSVNIFCQKFGIEKHGLLYKTLQQFFGSHPDLLQKDTYVNNPDYFSKFIKAQWGLNPELLCHKDELKRSRIKFSHLPDGYLLLQFLEKYKREIADMCFRSGMIHPYEEESIATHLLWSIKKDDIKAKKINIENILASSDRWKVSVNQPRQSTISVGPITIQMKGSEKSTPSSYHGMQFRASLQDILNHLEDRNNK